MSLECPNCRESVTFVRSIRTTAWGSFSCKFCGSILGISFGRRLMAMLFCMVLIGAMMIVFRVQDYGMHIYIPSLTVVTLISLYLFEHVVLVDRRWFTCKSCGYDLQGLTESRCPECGTGFDPADRERVAERINAPPPKTHRQTRLIAAIVVVLLSVGVGAGFVAWRKAVRRGPTPSPVPVAVPGDSAMPGG